MNKCQTLLHAGIIITQNASREILNDASIAIDHGRIVDLGPTEKLLTVWRADADLDLRGMLVLPGLVNAHAHAAMTFLRGLADDMPLMTWLEQNVFPTEARLTKEIVKLGSLLGYAEMLATGTTACIDMYIFEDAVFEAAQIAGIRCLGGEAIFNFPSAACSDWHEALNRTAGLASDYANHERISVAVNPHSVYTTNREILTACRKLALEQNLPLHIHLAETRAETESCLASNGMRPVAWCDELGIFDAHVIAAHLVDINENEIALLAQKGVCGAHNPSSNMKLASGIAPVCGMLEKGMRVALGSDGPASNNSLNMFVEMSRAALLHKLALNDPSALPASTVLDMATLGGSAALGDPSLGSLEPGKAADCIALDLRNPNMTPMHNPVSQAVYAASGHECRMTMIGGEIVYRDGAYARFDYNALMLEVGKLRDFASRKK